MPRKQKVPTPEELRRILTEKKTGVYNPEDQRRLDLERENERLRADLERLKRKAAKDPNILRDQVNQALMKSGGLNPFAILAEIAADVTVDVKERRMAAAELAGYVAPKMGSSPVKAEQDFNFNVTIEIPKLAANYAKAKSIHAAAAAPTLEAEVVQPAQLADAQPPIQAGDSAGEPDVGARADPPQGGEGIPEGAS